MKRVIFNCTVLNKTVKPPSHFRHLAGLQTCQKSDYSLDTRSLPKSSPYEPLSTDNLHINRPHNLNQPLSQAGQNTTHLFNDSQGSLENESHNKINGNNDHDPPDPSQLDTRNENPENQAEEEPYDILTESGFYGRMLNEIRRMQGLNEIPFNNSAEKYSELKSHYFLYKNYYDMRNLGSRFKIVLAQLEDLSMTQSRVPLQSVLELRHDSSTTTSTDIANDDYQTINPLNLSQKFTSHRLPPFPRVWNSPTALEQYLKELTSKKYPATMKKRSNLIKTIILDLLRENSPDTLYCRSTKAYNIAIRYFVISDDLKMARILFDQMKNEKGGIYPNTETFNLLLSRTPLRLVGGKGGYVNKYYNYYLRKNAADSKNASNSSSSFETKNNDDNSDTIAKFTPGSKDTVYFQNPLDFVISMFKEMVAMGVSANSETWNTILTSAIGPAAKSAVLESMSRLGVPLNTMGQTAVLTDIADFFGPQKALDMICAEGSSYPISPAAINVLVSRILDTPTSTNILVAWNIVRKYSIRQNIRYVNRKKVVSTRIDTKSNTSSRQYSRIIPSVSMLNTLIEPLVRLGRLDWMIGIISSFIYDYNISPNIKTWMCVLETVVLLPPHSLKGNLLEYIHYTMLKTLNVKDTNQLPPAAQSMIRRAKQQNKFHQEKLEQMTKEKNTPNSTDTNINTNHNNTIESTDYNKTEYTTPLQNFQNTTNLSALATSFSKTNIRDPFRKGKTKADIWGARELWVHACKQLKWTDTPKLFILDDCPETLISEETRKLKELLTHSVPTEKTSQVSAMNHESPKNNDSLSNQPVFSQKPIQNKPSWQEVVAESEFKFLQASTEASAFLSQFKEIGLYDDNKIRLTVDNETATVHNNPQLYALCKVLGVPEPASVPVRVTANSSTLDPKSFDTLPNESSSPLLEKLPLDLAFPYTIDTFPSFREEWVEFYAAAKFRFRKKKQDYERQRRLKMERDPYGTYIEDLKNEFGLGNEQFEDCEDTED